MANEFDSYREALVVETATIWPNEYDDWGEDDRQRVEAKLHESPEDAEDLAYERMHTGFSRVVTVTAADLERLGEG